MLVNAKNAKEQLFCHYILVTAIALTIKRTVYFSLFFFFFFTSFVTCFFLFC